VKLGKCAHENCAILSEAYDTNTVEKSSVFEQHKRLKDDWLNVEFIEGSGRNKTHKECDKNDEQINNPFCSEKAKYSTMLSMCKY
jgi:hypothetical protein